MTDPAQILAIAGACGYPRKEKRWLVPVGHGVCETAMQGFKSREEAVAWTFAAGAMMDPGEPQEYLETIQAPAYLDSLDAMHEAESVLMPEQWSAYIDKLKLVTGAAVVSLRSIQLVMLISATARQRAEAFLRTLDLWVEGV